MKAKSHSITLATHTILLFHQKSLIWSRQHSYTENNKIRVSAVHIRLEEKYSVQAVVHSLGIRFYKEDGTEV